MKLMSESIITGFLLATTGTDVIRASLPCTSSPFVKASPRHECFLSRIYILFTASIFVHEKRERWLTLSKN